MKIVLLLCFCTSFWGFTQKPEIVISNGHTDVIQALDISADGKFTATGSLDKRIKIIHNGTGKELRTFANNGGRVDFVRFDDDVKVIGAKFSSNELKFWSLESGELLSTYICDGSFSNFDYVLENQSVAMTNEDGRLALFNFRKQEKPREITNLDGVMSLKCNKNGNMAYAYTYKGAMHKVDLTNGQIILEKALFDKFVFTPTRIDVDNKDDFIAMAFNETEIHILKTSDFSQYHIFKGHESRIKDIKFDEESSTLLSLEHTSKDLFAWDVRKKKLIKRNEVVGFYATCIEPHPKQNTILISDNRDILYVDKKSFKVSKIRGTKANKVLNMAYDQQGKYLAASTEGLMEGKGVKLWDLERNKITKTFQGFWPVAIDPKGEKLLTNYMTIQMAIWDINTGEKIGQLPTDGDLIQKVAYSADGSMVAGIGLRGTVFIWDMNTNEIKQRIKWPAGMTYGIAFSPDGKMVAASGLQNSFYIWDVETGKELVHKEGFNLMMSDLKFSPDGTYFAACNWDTKVYTYSTSTWELIHTMEGHTNTIQTMDISKDGKYIVTGAGNNSVWSPDNSAIVWDAKTGKKVCQYKGHEGGINKVIFDRQSDLVYSTGDDGTIKAWDFKACNEVGTYVSVNETDYVITTPDYYYMASKDALDAVSFRIKDKLFPFDQFDLKLNRPDIVSSRLGKTPQGLINAYAYVYKKRLKKMNFTEESLGDDFHVPEVKLLTTNIPLVTAEDDLKFDIEVSDSKYKLDRINVYVNGVPLFGAQGIDLRSYQKQSLQHQIKVSLLTGENTIKISVLNDKGAESLRHTFSIYREGDEFEGDLYLVTVGVSNYKDTRFALKYPTVDARDVDETLSNSQNLYNTIHHKTLLDEDVTLENIKALKAYLSNAKPDDAVIVFVAGHGVLDDKFDYYFGTYDMDFDNPSKRGLPYEQLDALLLETKAIKKLLIMDTCHSGELDKDDVEKSTDQKTEIGDVKFRNAGQAVRKKEGFGMYNSVELMENMFSDIRRGSGAHVISSAGGVEFAMESDEWENGLFTYCLLRGLKNGRADADNDRRIVISELKAYVYDQVTKLSDSRQKPTAREENVSLDYRVW